MFDFLRTGQIGFVHLFYLNLILSIVIIFFKGEIRGQYGHGF